MEKSLRHTRLTRAMLIALTVATVSVAGCAGGGSSTDTSSGTPTPEEPDNGAGGGGSSSSATPSQVPADARSGNPQFVAWLLDWVPRDNQAREPFSIDATAIPADDNAEASPI